MGRKGLGLLWFAQIQKQLSKNKLPQINRFQAQLFKPQSLLQRPQLIHLSSRRCYSFRLIFVCTSQLPELTTRGQTLITTMYHQMRWTYLSQPLMRQTSVGKQMFASSKSIMSNMDPTVTKRLCWLKLKAKFSERVMTLQRVMN